MTKSDMSDFGDDIDDELLALATEDSDKKRKRKQSGGAGSSLGANAGGNKRRKAEVPRGSYDTPESEEDTSDPYPLEGKYKGEEDRKWLMSLSEIERERILAERADQKQQLEDEKILSQMVRDQRGAVTANGEEDRVSAAAKRQHTARGATKEKTKKLDELKAKRKAKDEKKKSRQLSPKRERSSSPMDMEISDEESEDGQITKDDEEEEKERKLLDKLNGGSRKHEEDQPATLADLEKCRITRDKLVKFCLAPWFDEFVQGAYVRFLVGCEANVNIYRICEISNLAADLVKPYKIEDRTMNQGLELKVGKSTRTWPMEKVSNGPFTENEFRWFESTLKVDKLKMPSKKQLERKVEQMERLMTQPITESDINAMLARKSQLSKNKSATSVTMERSRLTSARTLAERRLDFAEVAEIDKKLAELNASFEGGAVHPTVSEAEDKLAKVNERNRKANLEAVRRAEIAEAERKRKERKMAAMQGGELKAPVPHDPSARLKTVPRMFAAATPTGSRPGTPGGLTPTLGPTTKVSDVRPVSPLPPSVMAPKSPQPGAKTAFMDVEVDLGDF